MIRPVRQHVVSVVVSMNVSFGEERRVMLTQTLGRFTTPSGHRAYEDWAFNERSSGALNARQRDHARKRKRYSLNHLLRALLKLLRSCQKIAMAKGPSPVL